MSRIYGLPFAAVDPLYVQKREPRRRSTSTWASGPRATSPEGPTTSPKKRTCSHSIPPLDGAARFRLTAKVAAEDCAVVFADDDQGVLVRIRG